MWSHGWIQSRRDESTGPSQALYCSDIVLHASPWLTLYSLYFRPSLLAVPPEALSLLPHCCLQPADWVVSFLSAGVSESRSCP